MDFAEIALKWQKKWMDIKMFEPDVENREKFFITAAFPYPNSPQHIGHARTYTVADAYARYMRMRGKNVLFPMAFHVTGTPILAMAKRIKEKDEELIDIFTNIYGMDRKIAESLDDPKELVLKFSAEIEAGMKEMGFSIDWRRKFYTFDEEFNSFITWQFHKLKDAGLITKGKHPVPYCPKCNNPVGGHDTKGDVDPELGEYVLIKLKFEDGWLVPATLRPETIYGVTNVWVNKDAHYVKAKIDGEVYFVSKACVSKLGLQEHKVDVLKEIKGEYFINKECVVPIAGRNVKIYHSSFVDPNNATGVVMSVPAHAPYDYVALKQLLGDDAEKMLISIIKSDAELGEFPAKKVVNRLSITDVSDPKLEEATKIVYRKEAHHGIMSAGDENIKGKKVADAREIVKRMLKEQGNAFAMYEIINRPVKCRCGGIVEVKIFEDQWFIDYANDEWKERAKKCLSEMIIVPKQRKKDLEYAINWLHEKACTREHGFGTKFPFDESKMIEALSDSTVYMAFYTVKHLLKRPLSVDEWDYVLLGKGEGNRELDELRKCFEYWYPLDSRHSGADLLYNHLPFFIFNHCAIFDEGKWPKQIVINGFVLMDGQKMSKSLGNILPLRKAIKKYGPDPIRVSVVGGAELGEDTDFNSRMVEGIISRLKFIEEVAKHADEQTGKGVERWLVMRLNEYCRDAISSYESLNLRDVVNTLLYKYVNDIKWCIKRGGVVGKEAMELWVKFMSPIIPHYCDELWERMGNEGCASAQELSEKLLNAPYDKKLDEYERIIGQICDDMKEIAKLTNAKPEKVSIIIASPFKRKVFRLIGNARDGNQAIKNIMKDEEVRKNGKIAIGLVKRAMKWKSEVVLSEEEEMNAIRDALEFISKEINAKVQILSEENARKDEELKSKAEKSLPGKPSIYFH